MKFKVTQFSYTDEGNNLRSETVEADKFVMEANGAILLKDDKPVAFFMAPQSIVQVPENG